MARPRGAAAELAEREIKGTLTTNESNPVTSGGAEQLLAPDTERTFLSIVNLSAVIIYVGFNNQVSATNGFYLPPNGGSLTFNVIEDYEMVTNPIHIYDAGLGNQLYVARSRRVTKTKE